MIPVEHGVAWSGDLDEALDRFLDDLDEWAVEYARSARGQGVGTGHDQGTVMTCWLPLIRHRGAGELLDTMRWLRDGAAARWVRTGHWMHGYWRRQEVHHGTEHFQVFLGQLVDAAPDDAETRAQLLDAAEHIGNWVDDIPAWFDWESGLFRSMWLGTEVVGQGDDGALNVADHLRLAGLCLLADRVGGESRYLDLAVRYARVWAAAVAADGALPAGLLPSGPVVSAAAGPARAYRDVAGMAGALDDDVDRAENLFASGAVDLFLALWQRTGEALYLGAAERLLDILVTQVGDPDAGAVCQVLRLHRMLTGDDRYVDHVEHVYAAMEDWRPARLSRQSCRRPGPRPAGVGKRSDMPVWLEAGRPRRASPVFVGLVAEWRRDRELAARAVDVGRAYLELTRRGARGDERHGCGADTVTAVLRGHGRENGAGVLTGLVVPLLAGFPTAVADGGGAPAALPTRTGV